MTFISEDDIKDVVNSQEVAQVIKIEVTTSKL